MKKVIYTFLGATILLASCTSEETNTEESNETTKTEEVKVEEQPTYTVDAESVVVKWTAFKLTEKVGVGGVFDKTNLDVPGMLIEGKSPAYMMLGSTLTIDVNTINSDNPARDLKLVDEFFGKMNDTEKLEMTIMALSGKEEGEVFVEIKMNETIREVALNWCYATVDGNNVFSITGTIDVLEFGAADALASLNLACEDKHKGEGDESVTWPDVDIEASVVITESH